MDDIIAPIIVGIIFISFVMLVKILSDNRVRQKLIDKGMVDENVKYLFYNRFDYAVPGALKWGFVLIGIGLAFLIGQLVPVDYESEVTVSCLFIFAGIGLVAYYWVARHLLKEKSE